MYIRIRIDDGQRKKTTRNDNDYNSNVHNKKKQSVDYLLLFHAYDRNSMHSAHT